MKKIFSLLVTITLILGYSIPVVADTPKVGNKVVVAGGYEATVIGFTDEGKPIYQTTFGIPKYLPDLVTLYNTTWSDKVTEYQSGVNLFTSSVNEGMVSVQDKKGNAMTWQPTVTVENFEKIKDKSGIAEGIQTPKANKAKLLAVDPLNSNYKNNTLEWDYGNGLYRRVRIIEGVVQEYYIITKAIGGDLSIKANLGKSSNYKSDRVAYAYDADRQPIVLTLEADHNVKLTKEKSLDSKIKYPIIIDPDSTFISSASDGWMTKFSVVSFADARGGATGDSVQTSGIQIESCGYPGYWWWVTRGFVYFDTSSLAGYTISAATLGLYGAGAKADIDSYSVQIQSGQPDYPHDPMVVGDYLFSHYAGNGGTKTIAAWSTSAYNVFAMTDLTMINQTGTTKLALRLTGDINNAAPTSSNRVYAYSYEQGTGYQPYLTVTYTSLTPGVTSQPASSVAATTARLNAAITGDGGADCQVSWGYGTVSKAFGDWTYGTITAFAGVYRVGATPYLDITTLTPATPYYFRIQVKNALVKNGLATVTSTVEQTFTTSAATPANLATIYGIPLSTQIELSWVLASGSSQALLRYRTDTYPTSTTNGNQLYLGSASTYSHTGLTAGKTYYYSLWGESGGVYSALPITLAVTTKGTDPGTGANPDTPDLWTEFFQITDPSGLVNLEPIPTIVSGFATSWGMPLGNMWFFTTMMGIIFIAFLILISTKSLMGTAVFVLAAMFFSASLKLIPGWMISIPIFILLGAWALLKVSPQGR